MTRFLPYQYFLFKLEAQKNALNISFTKSLRVKGEKVGKKEIEFFPSELFS